MPHIVRHARLHDVNNAGDIETDPLMVSLKICIVACALAASLFLAVQVIGVSGSVVLGRLLIASLWIALSAMLLFVNRQTLSSIDSAGVRWVALGILWGMIAAITLGVAMIIALTAFANLGGTL